MLTSITPLGEQGRNRNWATTVFAYFVGSILGGSLVGFAAGLLGEVVRVSPVTAGWVGAAVLVMVALDELSIIRLTPLGERQVNEDWLDEYRGWVVGIGFGFQLGLGVVTIVTTLAIPATFVLAVLTGSWQMGIAVGVAFGLARALPILRTRPVTDAARLAGLHKAHDSAARWAHIGLAAVALPLAVVAVLA